MDLTLYMQYLSTLGFVTIYSCDGWSLYNYAAGAILVIDRQQYVILALGILKLVTERAVQKIAISTQYNSRFFCSVSKGLFSLAVVLIWPSGTDIY